MITSERDLREQIDYLLSDGFDNMRDAHQFVVDLRDFLENCYIHHEGLGVDVECGCGDKYAPFSYGAGHIHASGECPNCRAGRENDIG